jgi:uncharacterized protein (TIGR03083 family)
MHPPAPEDRAGLIDAFEHSLQAVVDLGTSCREDEFEWQTECPGWTVKDQISHVVGTERLMAGIERQPVPIPAYDHVRTEVDRYIERDVEARRGTPGREVVAELAEILPERVAQLKALDADVDTVIGGPLGPDMTLGQLLRMRIIDVWCHQQDIRVALDRPGELDSPGAAIFTEEILGALPRIAARVAGIGPGHAVVIDVTGPVVAREGVRVVHGADGRPYGESLFSGHDRPAGDEQLDLTSIHLTTEALTRRAAGRRAVDEIHFTVTGDEEIARRVLEALVIVH